MKKLVLALVAVFMAAFMITGCATDNAYNLTKTVYIGGKKVVTLNQDKIPADILEKMKKADNVVIKYDKAREEVKEVLQAVKDTKEK